MPDQDNLQKSEKVISKILQILIDRGIQQGQLEFEDTELDSTLFEFFWPCVIWLVDEGLIRASSVDPTGDGDVFLVNPVISSFGLHILGKEFSAGGASVKLAEAVRNVSEDRNSYSQVGDFFGGVLGGFTKSIAS